MVNFLTIIRNDIGDDLPAGSGQLYSDGQIVAFMERSVNKVNAIINSTFLVSPSGTVSPSGSAKEDEAIILCTECLIARREYQKAARTSIKAKQDENSLDKSNIAKSWAAMAMGPGGVCDDAKTLLGELKREQAGAASDGQVIWSGNQRLFEDVDFDGTGNDDIFNINTDIHRPF
jgi:hypothetical protein